MSITSLITTNATAYYYYMASAAGAGNFNNSVISFNPGWDATYDSKFFSLFNGYKDF